MRLAAIWHMLLPSMRNFQKQYDAHNIEILPDDMDSGIEGLTIQ